MVVAGAGTGGLGLAIEGPSEAKMTCKDNRDGSCCVEYLPTEPGEYDVSIKFSDQHIPGSPFKVSRQQRLSGSDLPAHIRYCVFFVLKKFKET